MEKEPVIDSRTAATIAANLIVEGGAVGGNELAKKPIVREILESLRDFSPVTIEQIIKELAYLAQNGHAKVPLDK